MNKNCPSCHKEYSDEDEKCTECGFPLNDIDNYIEKYDSKNIPSFKMYFLFFYEQYRFMYIVYGIITILFIFLTILLFISNNIALVTKIILVILTALSSVVPILSNIISPLISIKKDKKNNENKENKTINLFIYKDKLKFFGKFKDNDVELNLSYKNIKRIRNLTDYYFIYFNSEGKYISLIIDKSALSVESKQILKEIKQNASH